MPLHVSSFGFASNLYVILFLTVHHDDHDRNHEQKLNDMETKAHTFQIAYELDIDDIEAQRAAVFTRGNNCFRYLHPAFERTTHRRTEPPLINTVPFISRRILVDTTLDSTYNVQPRA
jgi:hypothetical protein